MSHRHRFVRSERRRGIIVVQVAVMLTVLMGMAALTIDVGMMYNARADLQRTADAASLAAAVMLSDYGTAQDPINALEEARAEAAKITALNPVLGKTISLGADDIVFGQAAINPTTGVYDFTPTENVPNSVRIITRMTADSENGALPLMFASIFGKNFTDVYASAVATLVPRDIVIVNDLSGSLSWDSQLYNYKDTDINLFEVWAALPIQKGNAGVGNGLDPPPPGNPNSQNDQPGTGPGSPANAGGNPNPGAEPFSDSDPHGPRWGWMTAWGDVLTNSSYNPTTDWGLFHIPRGSDTTDPDVIDNLNQAGYSVEEQAALLSSNYDNSDEAYHNRTKVMLGLAGWRSKKANSKFNGGPGNGDNQIETKELWQNASYPFDSGSWDDFIYYVSDDEVPPPGEPANAGNWMMDANSAFQYRFGLKTMVNFLLERKNQITETDELKDVPMQPLQAIKDASAEMVYLISDLKSNDQIALTMYADDALTTVDLTEAYNTVLWGMDGVSGGDISDRGILDSQASPINYTGFTNMGGGLEEAVAVLRGPQARLSAKKVILLLTDGNANITASGGYSPYGGADYARDQAALANQAGIQIHTVSVGVKANKTLMEEIAQIGGGSWFHAEGSIDSYKGQLDAIFKTLGGKRMVQLIQ